MHIQHWQDLAIALMYIPFNLALIPSLRSKHKPHLTTSIVTALCNFIVAFADLTLGLYVAAIAVTLNASIWVILSFQKFKES